MTDLLHRVVERINAVHDLSLKLGERFEKGSQGAFRLHDAGGVGYVLKWKQGERGLGRPELEAPLLERLRSVGYPVPRYVAWGVLDEPVGRYTVQEQLPGKSAWGITGQALEDALALNDRQVDAGGSLLDQGVAAHGRPAYEPWRVLLPRLTLEGGDGFCHLDAMREHSPETAALLGNVQEYVGSNAGLLEARPAQDVVHFDFSGPNILVDEGRLTGVVDWAPLPGDRAFDLATLVFYDGYYADVPSTRERIWARALELADAETFGVYLCHMIHRQTDWSVRHHDAEMVRRVLDVCGAVLRDLAARGVNTAERR